MEHWKESLVEFFAERSRDVTSEPTIEDLCYISGRDPRLWRRPGIYDDLVHSILQSAAAGPSSEVLEVGCAGGFLAYGVAPRVRQYVGVDLAAPALKVARRLRLPNATFRSADAQRLPFGDATFDAAFCYDVFTNLPDFEEGAGMIAEMLRVVRPAGRVLIGSIPDAATKAAYEASVAVVARELESEFGPSTRRERSRSPAFAQIVRRWVVSPPAPAIVCYYFDASDFVALGRTLGAEVTVSGIHAQNPYHGYRFNVVYTKPRT